MPVVQDYLTNKIIFMLKTACALTGDNYQLVVVDTPASKKKIVAMALAMMVPVLIWVFNGFMLASQVLETGFGWAVLTGLVCGIIVFFIEKLIVMANGNGWLTFFRICIGFIVAALGSIAIDEVVFNKDIDTSVASIKVNAIQQSKDEAAAEFMKLNGNDKLDKAIKNAQAKYDEAELAVIREADGTYGTGKRGAGKITALKDKKAAARKADLDKLVAQKAGIDQEMDKSVKNAEDKRAASFNEHALLIRIKALFKLVAKDGYMLATYILFTLLLFFFEFLVVVLKLTWKKTNYERKLEMIEEIGQRRMEFLQRKNSPLTDPGNFLPQFDKARQAVKRNSSLYNQVIMD